MFSGRASVRCPSVNTCSACCDITLLISEISMKLGIHLSCELALLKGCQGQGSKVKVTARILRRRHAFWWCGVAARLLKMRNIIIIFIVLLNL